MEVFVPFLIIFLELMTWVIILDIILSFLHPFLFSVRQNFTKPILDPIYARLSKMIKLQYGPFDLAPLVLMIIIHVLMGLIISATGFTVNGV